MDLNLISSKIGLGVVNQEMQYQENTYDSLKSDFRM
jgi:hypothetical protein